MSSSWTPISALGHIVYDAGFTYDGDQDIIYSRMDAPQRSFGYGFGYDEASLAMNAVLDCEPIFFDYGGKHWMIELWKGQYGLETGCEIGIYTRPIGTTDVGHTLLDATVGQRPGDGISSHNLFYDCAVDADRLVLSAKLHRDGELLFSRGPEMHWWLTGFKWGVLSDPSQLSLDVAITLKNNAMRDAFLAGLTGRPYPHLAVNGTTVSFTLDQPFAVPQPPRPALALDEAEASNLLVVDVYNSQSRPNNDPNQVDLEFLSVVGLGILQAGDYFGLSVAQLAIQIGESWSSVVAALTDLFGVADKTVLGWLSCMEQPFSTWVNEIENVLGLGLDFSTYVMIDNTAGTSDVVLSDSYATEGSYAVAPPARIVRGAIGRFVLQAPSPAPIGSAGTVTYAYCDEDLTIKAVVLAYQCPTGFAANTATSSQAEWECAAKSGSLNSPWTAAVPPAGHPLYVAYAFKAATPPPAVTQVMPPTGSTLGGDRIEIYGTHLRTTRQITFGGSAAEHWAVDDDNHIWASPPVGNAGAVDLDVATAGGNARAGFTYIAGLPVVEAITPSFGPNTGNTDVTIHGRGLTAVVTAWFGDRAEPAQPQSDTQAITSSGPGQGAVHVRVSDGNVLSQSSVNDLFSYGGPVVSSVDPTEGDEAGGTVVTITGSGLTGATAVMFGGAPATDLVHVSDTALTVRSPSGWGRPDVLVTAQGLTSLPSTADLFFYDGPTLQSVSPASGPDTAHTTITLTGTLLDHVENLYIDHAAAPFTLVSPTSITAAVPPGNGMTLIYVRSRYGNISNDVNFTHHLTPTITDITPTSGPESGHTTVVITGHDLMVGISERYVSIWFGTLFGYISSYTNTQITVDTPQGTGQVDILADDGFVKTAIGQYTYLSPTPLKIAGINPNAGG